MIISEASGVSVRERDPPPDLPCLYVSEETGTSIRENPCLLMGVEKKLAFAMGSESGTTGRAGGAMVTKKSTASQGWVAVVKEGVDIAAVARRAAADGATGIVVRCSDDAAKARVKKSLAPLKPAKGPGEGPPALPTLIVRERDMPASDHGYTIRGYDRKSGALIVQPKGGIAQKKVPADRPDYVKPADAAKIKGSAVSQGWVAVVKDGVDLHAAAAKAKADGATGLIVRCRDDLSVIRMRGEDSGVNMKDGPPVLPVMFVNTGAAQISEESGITVRGFEGRGAEKHVDILLKPPGSMAHEVTRLEAMVAPWTSPEELSQVGGPVSAMGFVALTREGPEIAAIGARARAEGASGVVVRSRGAASGAIAKGAKLPAMVIDDSAGSKLREKSELAGCKAKGKGHELLVKGQDEKLEAAAAPDLVKAELEGAFDGPVVTFGWTCIVGDGVDLKAAARRAKAEGATGLIVRCRGGVTMEDLQKSGAWGDPLELPTVFVEGGAVDALANRRSSLSGCETRDGREAELLLRKAADGESGVRERVRALVAPWTTKDQLANFDGPTASQGWVAVIHDGCRDLSKAAERAKAAGATSMIIRCNEVLTVDKLQEGASMAPPCLPAVYVNGSAVAALIGKGVNLHGCDLKNAEGDADLLVKQRRENQNADASPRRQDRQGEGNHAGGFSDDPWRLEALVAPWTTQDEMLQFQGPVVCDGWVAVVKEGVDIQAAAQRAMEQGATGLIVRCSAGSEFESTVLPTLLVDIGEDLGEAGSVLQSAQMKADQVELSIGDAGGKAKPAKARLAPGTEPSALSCFTGELVSEDWLAVFREGSGMDIRTAAKRAKAEGAAGMLIRCRDNVSLDVIRNQSPGGDDGQEAPNIPTVLVDDTLMDLNACLEGFDKAGANGFEDEIEVVMMAASGGVKGVKGYIAPWSNASEFGHLKPQVEATSALQRLQGAVAKTQALRSFGKPVAYAPITVDAEPGAPAPPAPGTKKWAPVHTSYLWGGQKINVNYGDRLPAPESAPKNNLTGKQAEIARMKLLAKSGGAPRRAGSILKRSDSMSKRVSINLTAEQEVADLDEEPGFRGPSKRGTVLESMDYEGMSFASSADGGSFAVQESDRRLSQTDAAQPLTGGVMQDGSARSVGGGKWGKARQGMKMNQAMGTIKSDRTGAVAVAAEDLPEELQAFFLPPWVAIVVTLAMIPCALIISGIWDPFM